MNEHEDKILKLDGYNDRIKIKESISILFFLSYSNNKI